MYTPYTELLFRGFEKDYSNYKVPIRFVKEEKRLWEKETVYQHGLANFLFLAYCKGYYRNKYDEEIRNKVMLEETKRLAIERNELKQQLKEARELLRLRKIENGEDTEI